MSLPGRWRKDARTNGVSKATNMIATTSRQIAEAADRHKRQQKERNARRRRTLLIDGLLYELEDMHLANESLLPYVRVLDMRDRIRAAGISIETLLLLHGCTIAKFHDALLNLQGEDTDEEDIDPIADSDDPKATVHIPKTQARRRKD